MYVVIRFWKPYTETGYTILIHGLIYILYYIRIIILCYANIVMTDDYGPESATAWAEGYTFPPEYVKIDVACQEASKCSPVPCGHCMLTVRSVCRVISRYYVITPQCSCPSRTTPHCVALLVIKLMHMYSCSHPSA
jgi:hypothetical protein